MNIQTFIFNWRGQYSETVKKETQIQELGRQPIIINSDDQYNDVPGWHHIGESSYFTAQYLKAIELFDGDILFHIQGDCNYDNWKKLYEDAEKYIEKYDCGIYAPNVDYTWYDSEKVDLYFELEDPNLKMVSNPDCTCWFVHKDIINEAKQRNINFAPFQMGWSFDIVYTALSFMMQRPVLRDYDHTVQHPPGTNYNKVQAEKEMHEFYSTLPSDLQEAFRYIKGDRHQLNKYYV